jgi:hypothetical protein
MEGESVWIIGGRNRLVSSKKALFFLVFLDLFLDLSGTVCHQLQASLRTTSILPLYLDHTYKAFR